MRRFALVMFVLSGAAALVFEVALQRMLARAFGVSAFATATVLAAYMTGLALGAVLFGRRADRAASPLRLYAWLEVGIGVCAVAMPWVCELAVAIFSRVAHGQPNDAALVIFGRLVLAFVVTLVPTVLMGGTLPAIARALSGGSGLSGAGDASGGASADVSRLYTANVLGAAAGAGLGAYAILPLLGLSKAMWLGAGFNGCAALIGFLIARRVAVVGVGAQVRMTRAQWTLIGLAAWSGLATFAAEVTWFELLAVVVGTTVYAFGLMLAVFLLGLTLGSAWVSRLPDSRVGFQLLGRVQLVTVAAIVLTLPLWDRTPTLFVIAGQFVSGFWAQELVRFFVCLQLLIVPAALLGVTYPLLLRVAARGASVGSAVGGIAAANTFGAVVGSLVTGFVLLPRVGARGMLVLIVVGTAGLATLFLRGRVRFAPAVLAVVALVLPEWNYARLASGSNVYFREIDYAQSEVVFVRESVSSGLTTVVRHPATGVLTLLTNGKFQGSNGGEVEAQRSFAQLPLLVQQGWERALNIGVGTGCTLGMIAAQPFAQVDAVDLSRDIIDAARLHFPEVNRRVFDRSNVTVHFADGRNHLLLTDARYDLISIELTTIWFVGAADLYGREFYRLVRAHLAPRGVLQQWVQLHHLSRHDLAVILQSMRAELPHVVLFFSGGQGIALASEEPIVVDYARVTALSERLRGSDAVAGIPAGDLLTRHGKVVLNEQAVAELIAEEALKAGGSPSELVSTDDNLYLEYSTPRANSDSSLSANALVDSFERWWELPLETSAPDDAARDHVRAAWHVGRGELAEALPLIERAAVSRSEAVPLRDWLIGRMKRSPAVE